MYLICIWVNVSYYLYSYVSSSLYGGTFNKPANIMNFIFPCRHQEQGDPGAGRSRSRVDQEQGDPGAGRVIQEQAG